MPVGLPSLPALFEHPARLPTAPLDRRAAAGILRRILRGAELESPRGPDPMAVEGTRVVQPRRPLEEREKAARRKLARRGQRGG